MTPATLPPARAGEPAPIEDGATISGLEGFAGEFALLAMPALLRVGTEKIDDNMEQKVARKKTGKKTGKKMGGGKSWLREFLLG